MRERTAFAAKKEYQRSLQKTQSQRVRDKK